MPDDRAIITGTINETARGDPAALTGRIVVAVTDAGYRIVQVTPGTEASALGDQPFDELTAEMRPQDTYGDGRDWTFETGEHGGDEPDNMPQTIKATDAIGMNYRRAVTTMCRLPGSCIANRPAGRASRARMFQRRTE